jgi:hypothetical protein
MLRFFRKPSLWDRRWGAEWVVPGDVVLLENVD